MNKIKRTKFKIGDIVKMKRFDLKDQYPSTIEDIYKIDGIVYYNIRWFGRPTFLASDGPFRSFELEKITLSKQELYKKYIECTDAFKSIWKSHIDNGTVDFQTINPFKT